MIRQLSIYILYRIVIKNILQKKKVPFHESVGKFFSEWELNFLDKVRNFYISLNI